MKWIIKLVFLLVANALALLAAAWLVPGFHLSLTPAIIVQVTVVFTLVNIFIKPIVKVILSPLIILTLGLAIVVINALMLYVVDWASAGLTIDTIPALVWSTLIISIVNGILHIASKRS